MPNRHDGWHPMQTAHFGKATITILEGDITREEVDAIVNAANSGLLGGGGVDGAIHRAGGPDIMTECRKIRDEQGGCPTGQAVITTAGRLPAKYVIHTVGPVWNARRAEECDQLLASAYRSSLKLASEHSLRTIAFPSISTGVYGFPIERAAPLVLRTVRQALEEEGSDFQAVRFVLFSRSDRMVYEESLDTLLGGKGK